MVTILEGTIFRKVSVCQIYNLHFFLKMSLKRIGITYPLLLDKFLSSNQIDMSRLQLMSFYSRILFIIFIIVHAKRHYSIVKYSIKTV